MTRKCENCQWWVFPSHDGYGEIGQCRGSIPKQPNDGKMGVWPLTYGSSWCGSFRLREGLETAE